MSSKLLNHYYDEIVKLLEEDFSAPVFLAANLDGGAEWNAKYMAENADRIFYLN